MRRRWKRRLLWAAVLFGLVLLAIPAMVASATRSVSTYLERRPPMRKLLALAVLAAVAAVVGTSTLATASSSSAAQSMDLVAVELPKSEVVVDVGKKGDSDGDSVFFAESLLRNGKKIGRSDIYCVFTRVMSRCNATLTVPGGTLEALGGTRFGKTFAVAVVGGTGTYAGARGVIRVTELGDTRTRYAVDLTG